MGLNNINKDNELNIILKCFTLVVRIRDDFF